MTTKTKIYFGIFLVLLLLIGGEILILFFPKNSQLSPLVKYLPHPAPTVLPAAPPAFSNDLPLGDMVTASNLSFFIMRVKLLKAYQDKDSIKADIAYNRGGGNGSFSQSTIMLGEIKPLLTPFSIQMQDIDRLSPTSDHVAPQIVKPISGTQILTQLKPYINGIVYIQFRTKIPPAITKYVKKGNPNYDYNFTFLPSNYDCNVKFYDYLLNPHPLPSCLPFSDSLKIYVTKL